MSVWTYFGALLLIFCGVYLSFKLRFYQVLGLKDIFSVTVSKLLKTKDFAGFKAMCLALGSTIGIGNIVGVSAAIILGGPGAIFWMLVSGFLGMIIKYAEVYICVDDALKAKRKNGGPMFVLRGIWGPFFAIIVILATVFAGNMMQSKAIFEFIIIGFDITPIAVCLLTIPPLFLIVSGKDRLYQSFSSLFVPIVSLLYIAATVIIIAVNFHNVPLALKLIFKSAFGFSSVGGGFSGAAISAAVRNGMMKGLFTHEAGMGSAPIAHASAIVKEPHTQGAWGIIEVFIDTVIVCSLTALAILSSPCYINGGFNDPFRLVLSVFSDVFGKLGLKSLSLFAFLFAFAAMVGWSFYGAKAVEYLGAGNKLKRAYAAIFALAFPLSLFLPDNLIWSFTDIFNTLMLLPNVIMIFCLADRIVIKKGSFKNDLQPLPEKLRCIKNRN